MEIVLVRHGESEANAAGIIQGRGDYRLNAKGREQALATATALIGFRPYRIYTSPLLRALETAQILNRPHNIEIITLDDLIEYNLGDFEGLSGDEILERFPSLPEDLRQGVPFHHLAPGAETDQAAADRAERAFKEIQNSGLPRVIVVSHLGILDHLLRIIAREADLEDLLAALTGPLNNASITWLQLDPFTARLIKINDTSHLA